jgi:glyoxylase-like metal-dependent hydrolase (beta-lactamase superfamily II)
MPYWICETCAVQYPESAEPPERCAICEDERQYVGLDGQRWTTLEKLRASQRAEIREEEPGLLGIGMEPSFAIGQRALLVGDVLWDCIPLLDEAIVEAVRARGGLSAIALSHPHYYSTICEWSEAFDAPVYVHADDAEWLQRRDGRIEPWTGETLDLSGRLTVVRCGGHFPGASVLHWAERGILLTGDTIQVIPDREWVSFMYSYPNLIPLDAAAIQRIVAAVEPLEFDRIYGAWWGRVVPAGAKEAVVRSAERYIAAIR